MILSASDCDALGKRARNDPCFCLRLLYSRYEEISYPLIGLMYREEDPLTF